MSDEGIAGGLMLAVLLGAFGGFVVGDLFGKHVLRTEQCAAVCAPAEGALREGKCFCLTAKEGK